MRPLPPTPEVSRRMARVRTRGTAPEIRVRRALRELRIAFRTTGYSLPGSPDFLLRGSPVALFVDGCFWHGCPRCYREPRRNRAWWRRKIEGNVRRDRRTAAALRRRGYRVIRIREHDDHARILRRLSSI